MEHYTRLAIVSLVVISGGCSSSSSSDADAASDDALVTDTTSDGPQALPESHAPRAGTRLSPLYLRGGDAHLFSGLFFDKTSDGNCRFAITESSGIRCIPIAQAGSNQRGEMALFSDPQCKASLIPIASAVAEQWKSCGLESSEPVVHFRFDDKCPESSLAPFSSAIAAAFRLNSRHTPQDDSVYRLAPDGSCTPEAANPYRIYYRATPLPFEDFVSAKSSLLGDTAGLAARVLEAADGAKQLLSLHDGGHDAHCDFQWAEDQSLRCFPSEKWASATASYADANCKDLLAVKTSRCVAPSFGRKSSERSCGRGLSHRYYSLGEATSVGYTKTTTCRLLPPGEYFRVAAALDAGEFPLGTTRTRGSGRLQRLMVEASGELSVQLALWDRQLEGRCAILRTADDKLRCIPNAMSSNAYYQDPGCTQRMAPLTCSAAKPFYVLVKDPDALSCRVASRLFAVGESLGSTTQKTFYFKSGKTACNAGTLSGPDTEWVRLAEEIDPKTFVEVSEPSL